MSSILKKFKQIEQVVKVEDVNASDSNVTSISATQDSTNASPLPKAGSSVDTEKVSTVSQNTASPQRQIKQTNTILKKVKTSDLVWAKHFNLKGYICGRICPQADCATEWIEESKLEDLKSDEYRLIEYFNVPNTYPRMDVISIKNIYPYNCSSKINGNITTTNDKWNEESKNKMILSFKNKAFNANEVDVICSSIFEKAEQFLRMANDVSENDVYENDTEIENFAVKDDPIEAIEDQSLVLSKYARAKLKKGEKLCIGDTVEFRHSLFKDVTICKTVSNIVNDGDDNYVVLESGDRIYKGTLIKKVNGSNKYRKFEEFNLIHENNSPTLKRKSRK